MLSKVGTGWMGSSNGDSFLMSPAGLNAAFGRGCLREATSGPLSTVGEGGEEDKVEQAENQGYSLTVSFQTFGSVEWCTIAYTASVIMYASTGKDVNYGGGQTGLAHILMRSPMRNQVGFFLKGTHSQRLCLQRAFKRLVSVPRVKSRESVTNLDVVDIGCWARSLTELQRQLSS